MKYSSLFFLFLFSLIMARAGDRYNFNPDWLLHVGDDDRAYHVKYNDSHWTSITLPRAFNEDEAFAVGIRELTDTIMWYRKHFRLPPGSDGRKVFVEFEGVRQGADVYLNGHYVGLHENGVMAFGFDLTPYIKYDGDNVMAVRVNNSWKYRERATNTGYQWNDRNFNANYGGIVKNVYLHLTGPVYQTLPLYSNLGTLGVYIYASDIDIAARKARICVEAQVKNESTTDRQIHLRTEVIDPEGHSLKTFVGPATRVPAGAMGLLTAEATMTDLHFWSWGYGYLYDVRTSLVDGDETLDEVVTRTGFRKTEFGQGLVWLNDRVIQLKGFAHRSSNEWPALGLSVPAWMSDFSNNLMVACNGNIVRWMHVTPSKQDVESCDRVGLIQAMPAGDSEKNRNGRQWEQRKEVMRDAIIYNRNNPSILFYESGNNNISREHIVEMRALRDLYDPHGGRAIGSREMLDIDESEYGGEMLYINKSAGKPLWAMEYCRDEAQRKFWDNYSYPYHQDGDGRGRLRKPGYEVYNRNNDSFLCENVLRWYEYFRERPGTGRRVSSGGAKITFSDSNTHFRGYDNYRCSGAVDPMRLPKDVYYAHRVMWSGWVDIEQPDIYITGHWNYADTVVKDIYVVANTPRVSLFVNGRQLDEPVRQHHFLFTFASVPFEAGTLEAVGYDDQGQEACRTALHTAGTPAALRLTPIENPDGWKADGADILLVDVEVVDSEGRRCPLADNLVSFTINGPAEWRGGLAGGRDDNYVLQTSLPVECGVNRVMLRSTTTAGQITLSTQAEGLNPAHLSARTTVIDNQHGLSTYIASEHQPARYDRGPTPSTPSYRPSMTDVPIKAVRAGSNDSIAHLSIDDNELT